MRAEGYLPACFLCLQRRNTFEERSILHSTHTARRARNLILHKIIALPPNRPALLVLRYQPSNPRSHDPSWYHKTICRKSKFYTSLLKNKKTKNSLEPAEARVDGGRRRATRNWGDAQGARVPDLQPPLLERVRFGSEPKLGQFLDGEAHHTNSRSARWCLLD